MADVIAKLQVDSSQYDGKLKTAIEQMTKMEQEVRRTGATFAYADKEELEFIKSIGELGTQASSAKSKLREYSDAITSLTATYRAMTDEEKKSEPGKALAASIDNLKIKAAELKDIMSDTNIELKNLASDTNFTDGLNLMTRTIGASASAIVAWTGDSKEMEAVIKDLAKIGTTVAAVDQLTKAFQKQNLVLLKNPYVAAAAALVAMAVAIGKVIKKSQELSAVEKTLQEVEQKGREGAAQEVTRIDTLNNILHDNTRSLEDRKNALSEIQALVPDYHGALTEEGNLINDNTGAIDDYIDSLQRAALAQAAFDKMVELQKKKMEEQVKLQKAQKELERAQSMAAAPAPNVATGGAGAISMGGATAGVRQGEVRTAQNEVNSIQKVIDEQDAQINALRDLVKSNDIGTTGTGKGAKTAGTVKVKAEVELPEGSLAKLQDDLKKAQEKFRMATDDPGRVAAKKEIDEITEAIKRMTAEEQNAAADGSIAAMRQKLQQLTEEWENAADPTTREELKKQIMEVSDTLSQMEGNNKKATSALSMWGDHQAKIEETMDLLRQFHTMMDDPNIGEGQRKWAEEMAKSYEEQLKKMMGDTDQAVATMQDSLNNLSAGVGAISTLGNAFNDLKGIGEDLASAFSGEMDAWDALMTVFNSGIGIMETVIGVMEAINTLTNLSTILTGANTAAKEAEATATVTGATEEVAAEGEKATASGIAAGASAAESAASAGKSVAGIPIVGPILAVAAIGAVLAAVLAAMSKSKSAGKFAQGGIVGGNNYNDGLVANVSSGELILNRAQQASIAGQLQGNNPMSNLRLSTEISGTNLRIVMNNDNRARGGSRGYYSEIH